jgi:thiosulfate dehydrogenase
MKKFLLGLLIGVLLVPAAGYAFLRFGNPPVATADPAMPLERQIVRVPLGARIRREMPDVPAIPTDEAAFAAGATLYRAQCAACHGLPDRPSTFAKGMYPHAPQLFARHGDKVGVSEEPVGASYWRVKNGVRLSGMPAYDDVLSEKEMWQVTLLVANADKLSTAVQQQLKAPPAGEPPLKTPAAAK